MFRLSRLGYYADFLLAPIGIAALLGWQLGTRFFLFACMGLLSWSLAEYLIHRFAFHGLPYLRREHDRHHREPEAYIGVGSWATAAVLLVLWGTARCLMLADDADASAAGLLLGYLTYIVVHDLFHHARPQPGHLLYAQFHRHAIHHRGIAKNFGVSTAAWDRVFLTYQR